MIILDRNYRPDEPSRRFEVLAALVAALPLAMLIFWAVLRWSLT